MIFTKLLPFSSLLFFLEKYLSMIRLCFERFSIRFFLFTFLIVSTLLHKAIAVDEVYWDETKLRYFSEQALSPAALAFQEAFLAEVLSYANEEDVRSFALGFQEISSRLRSGPDEDIRPVYVSAQGDFERTMAYFLNEGKITHLIGIIHTPTPATPLCTRGEISRDLVDRSMQEDSRRLYTVMKRPEIIRDYMQKGGVLIAAYPENGLAKRTEEQQAIFQNAKKAFPDQLIDLPLSCEEMQKDMIGATYLFRAETGDWMAFAIMAAQANAPEDGKVWGMWFGSLTDPLIYSRVHSLFSYLHTVQEKDLSPLLFGIY